MMDVAQVGSGKNVGFNFFFHKTSRNYEPREGNCPCAPKRSRSLRLYHDLDKLQQQRQDKPEQLHHLLEDGHQRRIQDFVNGGGPKFESEARIKGAKRPSIEGEARIEGAKCPRIQRNSNRGQNPRKSGGGVWEGLGEPSPENFCKFKLTSWQPCNLVYIWSHI